MKNGTATLSKLLRKTEEQAAFQGPGSKISGILERLGSEVAAPLDESVLLCQRLLDELLVRPSREQRSCVEGIAENAATTARRVRDYVDLLHLEGGNLALYPQPLDLEEAISRVADSFRAAALAKGLGLAVESSTRALPVVRADPARLEHVLASLISNAIRYTERGQVAISTELYDRSVAVHVVDTGIGISSAELPRLFEDFFQSRDSQKLDQHGSGLGLTLSRRLVIRMGGDLWASSTVGTGSKFTFTVPRSPEPMAQPRVGTA